MKKKRHRKQTKRPGDHYYNEAKDQGFLARSVFKLEEIDKKYNLLPAKKGKPISVIDLGCAPGSWLQYILKKLRPEDRVVAIDLNSIEISDPRLSFIQKDINKISVDELISLNDGSYFDTVLSDMAPKTTGIKLTDQTASIELCEMALNLAKKTLRQDANFIVKVFQSNYVKPFVEELKTNFRDVKIFKPESSRRESFEVYIIAKGFLPNNQE